MSDTRVYRLGQRFVYDHWSRDLPENQAGISRRIGESKRTIDVELNAVGYDELLSDARYYAESMSDAGFDDAFAKAVCRSAASVVAALVKAGPPEEVAA